MSIMCVREKGDDFYALKMSVSVCVCTSKRAKPYTYLCPFTTKSGDATIFCNLKG